MRVRAYTTTHAHTQINHRRQAPQARQERALCSLFPSILYYGCSSLVWRQVSLPAPSPQLPLLYPLESSSGRHLAGGRPQAHASHPFLWPLAPLRAPLPLLSFSALVCLVSGVWPYEYSLLPRLGPHDWPSCQLWPPLVRTLSVGPPLPRAASPPHCLCRPLL